MKLLAAALLLSIASTSSIAATCTGSAECKACRDCSLCWRCSPKNPKRESCGVCRAQDGAAQKKRDAKREKNRR